MPNAGKLKIKLTDVHGKPLAEEVHVSLRHQATGGEIRTRIPAGKAAIITDLRAEPDGIYRVEIDPPSYLPVGQFVSVKSSGPTALSLTFPIDPKKVSRLTCPAAADLAPDARRLLDASDSVLAFGGCAGASLYERLDDIRRAGFLNIVAKATNTTFAGGRTVLSYVQKLNELRGDRFFAVVSKELREEAKNALASGLFVTAPGCLHHPPEGFQDAGSFKTNDHYGNLQLTFFVRGDEWRADIDIDDAAGIAHVFQVLRNTLSGRPTHPYDIHQLLVHYQKVDPGYSFIV
jgi:hypothetical protein